MTAQIDPFHAIAISGIAHRLKAEGRSVIHMEFGQPSTGAPAAAQSPRRTGCSMPIRWGTGKAPR
jgi:hypothetical protein